MSDILNEIKTATADLAKRLEVSQLADVEETKNLVERTFVGAEEKWKERIEKDIGKATGQWLELWAQQRGIGHGAVECIRTKEVHEVAVGDVTVPPCLWATRCGWRFGLADHRRREAPDIQCKKCLRKTHLLPAGGR